MSVRYSEDFKKEVVRAYMAGNKSTIQIAFLKKAAAFFAKEID